MYGWTKSIVSGQELVSHEDVHARAFSGDEAAMDAILNQRRIVERVRSDRVEYVFDAPVMTGQAISFSGPIEGAPALEEFPDHESRLSALRAWCWREW